MKAPDPDLAERTMCAYDRLHGSVTRSIPLVAGLVGGFEWGVGNSYGLSHLSCKYKNVDIPQFFDTRFIGVRV